MPPLRYDIGRGVIGDGCEKYRVQLYALPKGHAMKKFRPSASMFEPATYRIGIMGTLDEKWSDYCGGMAIEHDIVLDQYPITILRGLLADQAALVGVINTLYDMGCPIVLVECVENGVTSDRFRSAG